MLQILKFSSISGSNSRTSIRKVRRWIVFILFIIPFMLYFQVINHEFISFDDYQYITENPIINKGLTLEGLLMIFTTNLTYLNRITYWHPLTWFSHMLDVELFGLDAGMHHLINLIFHIVNTLLLYIILRKMTGAVWRSALVAILFAIHPINVDTVAWISERKNLLSSFFWMLTMLLYFYHTKSSNILFYILSLLTFTLGLMAKPSLVTLPIILLLVDYWPLQRLKLSVKNVFTNYKKNMILKLILEKFPFLILSVAAILIPVFMLQNINAYIPFSYRSLFFRITTAIVSYAMYVMKTLIPINLTTYYPYPRSILPYWQVIISLLFLLIITFFCITHYKKRPYLIVGWFWFLITLLPMSGLLQGGLWPLIAERWAYIPTVGIFIMFSWGVFELSLITRLNKKIFTILLHSFLLLLCLLTFKQAGYWINNYTLFSHSIHVMPNDIVAHNQLALDYLIKHDIEKAIYHLKNAVNLNPENKYSLNILGNIYSNKNKSDIAIKYFGLAIESDPNFDLGHCNLATEFYKTGDKIKALYHYQRAANLAPDNSLYHKYLGITLQDLGDINSSIDEFNRAIKISEDADVYYYLGSAYSKQNRLDEGASLLRKALKIKVTHAKARTELGSILIKQGNFDDAIHQLQIAMRLDPDFAENYALLGNAYYFKGNFEDAISHYKKAIIIKPDFAEVYSNMGAVLLSQKKLEDAIIQLKKALQFKPDLEDAQLNLRAALDMKYYNNSGK